MRKVLLGCSLSSLLLFSLFFASSLSFRLNFNSEGEFTVLQLTDLHFGQSDSLDDNTMRLQRNMIAKVKPDLIVISGDGVSGYEGFIMDTFHTPYFYEKNWKKFTQPISEAGVPYAFTLGNHDVEGDLDKHEIAKLDMTHPLSIRKTSEGIPNTLNFYVPVYSSQNKDTLAANVWLFDSGRKGCMGQEDSWGCVEENQIQWYERESKKIKEQHGTDVHHIAFVHIPPPEYMMLANDLEIYGRADEAVCCPTANSGFVDRVKEGNDISAIFVGHDHNNNFGGWYNGIELVYGQKSGYGNYGGVRGVRVIKFKENVDRQGKLNVQRNHYVIYENGTIDTSKDLYEKTDYKQLKCYSAGFDSTFMNLREKRFFDYLLIVVVILLIFLGVYTLRKMKCGSSRQEQSPLIDATGVSNEPIAINSL